jgi:hypothetical protein
LASLAVASSGEAYPNMRAKAVLQLRMRPSGEVMKSPVRSSSKNRR